MHELNNDFIFVTLLIFQFDISGKLFNFVQQQKAPAKFYTFFKSHFDISGNKLIDSNPLNTLLISVTAFVFQFSIP